MAMLRFSDSFVLHGLRAAGLLLLVSAGSTQAAPAASSPPVQPSPHNGSGHAVSSETPTLLELRQNLAAAEAQQGASSAQVMKALAELLTALGRSSEPAADLPALAQRLGELGEQTFGAEHQESAAAWALGGSVLLKHKRLDAAEQMLSRALTVTEATAAVGTRFKLNLLNQLVLLRTQQENFEQLEAVAEKKLTLVRKMHGLHHVETADALRTLALARVRLGKYRQAADDIRAAQPIYEDVFRPDDQQLAERLGLLGNLYLAMGHFQEAHPLYERALTISAQQLGSNHVVTVARRHQLARSHAALGRHEQAFPLFTQNLQIARAILGDDHLGTASALNGLAEQHLSMGEPAKAIPLLERSLEIRKKLLGEDHQATATSLHNLALAHGELGHHARALALSRQSLDIRRRLHGGEHRSIAVNLANLAFLHDKMGNHSKALSLHRQSLAMSRRTLGAEHPRTATALNNLASYLASVGQYSEALTFNQRSLALREKALGTNHPDTITSIQNLAATYFSLGRIDQATRLTRQGLDLMISSLGENNTRTAVLYNNLAVLHINRQDYKQALLAADKALAINQDLLPDDHPAIATNLDNLASAHERMGDREKALRLRQRALRIREKSLGKTHPSSVGTKSDFGFLYATIGDHAKARKHFDEAIALSVSRDGGTETLWRAQYGLFRVNQLQGNADFAILWGKEAVNTIQGLRTRVGNLEQQLQADFLANKLHVYQDLADALIAQDRIAEAQIVLQMLKEQELHQTLQRSSNQDVRATRIPLTGLESSVLRPYRLLQSQLAELSKVRAQLEQRQTLGQLTTEDQGRLASIRRELLSRRAAMLEFLRSLDAPPPAPGRDDVPAEQTRVGTFATNLHKALLQAENANPNAGMVAIQYVIGKDRLSILATTADHPLLARQLPVDAKVLRDRVAIAHELLSDPQSDPTRLHDTLHSLYQQLIAPVAEDLAWLEAKTLVLVPNGVLRYVPFAALFDGERYLVQDYSLTLFNEAVEKDLSRPMKQQGRLAAMGLTREVETFPALAYVRDELESITQRSGLPGVMYLDDDFTRAVLTASLEKDFNILHLASHFEFVPGRPDASRLFLGDRSSLYLADIARDNLRFDHFSLVTFSACETGLGGGGLADGRDMESLGALVQIQGASAVMATLWKIDDYSTAKLMEAFYRSHHQGRLSKAGALRQAQLKFIKGSRVLSHPYRWAPFVLMGDWR